MLLGITVMLFRRIPGVLLLYKFVPNIENLSQALLVGHFGVSWASISLNARGKRERQYRASNMAHRSPLASELCSTRSWLRRSSLKILSAETW